MMMEIERLKILKVEEDRETAKKIALKKGQQVIIEQISERHQRRVRDVDLKERENIMLK